MRLGIDDILLEQDGENIELSDDYDKAQALNDCFVLYLVSLLNLRMLYQK